MKKLLVIILIFLILPICNYIVSADNTTYMEDFEKTTNASDYILAGNPTSKSIVNIDNNKQLLLSRAANATGDGWVDKTFSTPFSGDIVLEMKIKSTSSIFHQVKLSKAGGGSLPAFNISGNGCSLNGTYKDLPNRGDGKFHSYKFVIKNLVAGSNALIDFYYDNSKLFSDVSSSSILADVNNLRFALSAGSSVSEVYFDNIAIYPLANPIPSIVKCSPEGGVLKPSDKITLTGDNGADIYYTLDGSTPTQTSNLYTGPFSLLNDNATIRTIAIKNNFGGFVANYGPFSVENFIFNDFEVGVDNFFKTISGNAPILQTTNFNNMARLDVGNYKLDFAAPFTANFKIVFLQEGNSKITLYNNSNVAGSFLASSGSYSLSVDYTNKIVSVVNNGILQETINITENQLTSLEFLTSSSVLLDDFSAYKASTSIPSPVACSAVPGYISREKGITLTAETGAVIRYTSDGSIPTVSSTIYTAPILPSNLKTIIKAKAFKDGKESFCRAFGEFKLDNSYQYDFEKYNENATIASIGFFDGDYGNLATNKVVKENGNTAIYFERNSVDSSTGAWVQKTFPTPYSEDFIFQFKMKSTVAEFKQVTMTTNVSGKNVGLNISPGGCTINGQTISMPDFSDGNYHNYEFHIKFTPLGASFDFYYDKKLLKKDIVLGDDVNNFKTFRITLGKSVGTIPNNAYIDDLMLYLADNPYPDSVACSGNSGQINVNQAFSLSAEEGADIYYSTDGSYPLIDVAHKYTQPFMLRNKTNYIKAFAVKNDKQSTAAIYGPFNLKNIDGIILLNNPVFNSNSPADVTSCTVQVKNLETFTKNITAIICLYKNNELISIMEQEYSLPSNTVQDITTKIIANSNADKAVFYVWSDKNTTYAPISAKTMMR